MLSRYLKALNFIVCTIDIIHEVVYSRTDACPKCEVIPKEVYNGIMLIVAAY